ncbi:MerR family transcriptional regulator [Marinobacterium aestuariivivens]|uniref:Helix-turn-helix domain-containing protein n=1 Tax=Marinobacterium aestuariivivens TaxID=1698799 RepID=A0ABW2A7H9_9GAMM
MISIGQLARHTGVKVPTVRYYEKIGLLPEPARSEGNQRLYPPSMVERLAFIHHARALGFSLDGIRDLLSLADHPDQPCDAADEIARAQLVAVERRIRQLQSLQQELQRMLRQCHSGRISECRVIEVLSDHSQCLQDHPKMQSPDMSDKS